MSKLLSFLKSRFRPAVWSVLLLAVVLGGLSSSGKFGGSSLREILFGRLKEHEQQNPGPVHREIATALMSLNVTTYRLPKDYRLGAIEWLDAHRVLLADGAGRFSVFDHADGRASLRPTAVSVAINRTALAAYGAQTHADIQVDWLRVNDLVLFNDRRSLGVSYTHWNDEEKCYALIVAVRTLPADWSTATNDGWRQVFQTKPCLKLKLTSYPFAGQQSGGRLVDAGNGKLWLSVGDFEFDGLDGTEKISQQPDTDYGKILELDTRAGTSRHISFGLRNPQGLAVDDRGRLWSTEHGPRGGDELNLIVEGQNYVWPEVSLGVDYNLLYWPLTHRQGRHDSYSSPKFAWVPSVGISQLIQLHNFSEEWDGDLLVGSLPANTLYRLRMEGDAVRYAEPIKIDKRVRDIIQDPTGAIWVWSDNSVLIDIRPGVTASARSNSGASANVALARCTECHDMSTGSGSRISLAGIVGRPVASNAGIEYSAALRSLGGIWTEERLDAFLKDPDRMAPGTPMAQQAVGDEQRRARIIDVLKSLK